MNPWLYNFYTRDTPILPDYRWIKYLDASVPVITTDKLFSISFKVPSLKMPTTQVGIQDFDVFYCKVYDVCVVLQAERRRVSEWRSRAPPRAPTSTSVQTRSWTRGTDYPNSRRYHRAFSARPSRSTWSSESPSRVQTELIYLWITGIYVVKTVSAGQFSPLTYSFFPIGYVFALLALIRRVCLWND